MVVISSSSMFVVNANRIARYNFEKHFSTKPRLHYIIDTPSFRLDFNRVQDLDGIEVQIKSHSSILSFSKRSEEEQHELYEIGRKGNIWPFAYDPKNFYAANGKIDPDLVRAELGEMLPYPLTDEIAVKWAVVILSREHHIPVAPIVKAMEERNFSTEHLKSCINAARPLQGHEDSPIYLSKIIDRCPNDIYDADFIHDFILIEKGRPAQLSNSVKEEQIIQDGSTLI